MSQKKKPINLLRGWPSASLLPVPALRASFQEALSDPAVWEPGLQYGPDPGYQPLREALASWLSAFYTFTTPTTTTASDKMAQYTHAADPSRICITGGASQSIAALLTRFTGADPAAETRAVWMAAPCYFLACPIFADAGFAVRDRRLRAVPEDPEGPDLDFLAQGMRELDREAEEERERCERLRGPISESEPTTTATTTTAAAADTTGGEPTRRHGYCWKDPSYRGRKIYKHVIYCSPSFSNPTGKTMSLARREGLVRLAREFDALIISDDVYDHLQWPGARDTDDDTQQEEAAAETETVTTASPASEDVAAAASPPRLRRALLPRLLDIDLSLGRSAHDPPTQTFGHVSCFRCEPLPSVACRKRTYISLCLSIGACSLVRRGRELQGSLLHNLDEERTDSA